MNRASLIAGYTAESARLESAAGERGCDVSSDAVSACDGGGCGGMDFVDGVVGVLGEGTEPYAALPFGGVGVLFVGPIGVTCKGSDVLVV